MANGRKNILPSFHTIVAGDMSANITSPVTEIRYLDDIGIQLNWTGSPTGTFAVQVSADYSVDTVGGGTVLNPGNWISVALSYLVAGIPTTSTTIPTSVGSPIYIDLQQLSAPYIRIIYVGTGVGVLDAYITAKEI